jgi:two-component system chemotaxis sensor kinase CheA
LTELSKAIREVGEVVSTLPSPGEAADAQIRFSLLAATQIPAEQLLERLERLELPNTTVRVVHEATPPEAHMAEPDWATPPDADDSASPGSDAAPRVASQIAPGPKTPMAPAPEGGEFESLKSISETVRVDIRKLDELMTLVGELAIQRSAVADVAARLSADPATQRVGVDLSRIHKMLDRKLKELQSGVLDVRMVPLRQIFEKLSRVVRRLRRDLGKEVRLEFKGADTELDKLVVEELVDPFLHLVRNACDHGIEPAQERIAAGKPEVGTILIEATQRGNHVVINVSDDGRGIDPAVVRARAEASGLITPEDVLTVKETLALVFEAGLSTRDEVSETSGRGVGMDVVRSNLTALGGLVDLSSEVGSGTRISLTLPITLAIIQALIVGVGDQRFAVPLSAVLETLLVDESTIQHSEGREILNLRGEPLPLRRLADEFGLPAAPEIEGKQYVVVLGLGDLRMGLCVDRFEGQRDTVIKPIRGPIRQVRGIAGATEMADAGAILVLDVSSFVEDAVRRRDTT